MTTYNVGEVYIASNGLPLQITHVEEVSPGVKAIHVAHWAPDKRVMFAVFSPEALDAEPLVYRHMAMITDDLLEEASLHATMEGEGRGVFIIPPRELLQICMTKFPKPDYWHNYHPYPTTLPT